jgi:hypothetical protein
MTILDELDELEPDSDMTGFTASFGDVTLCPECGHVDDEMETLRNCPCQACGRNCATRQILFSGEEEEILAMIFECYRSKHSRSACVLLFCSLMELHLRMLILRRWRWLEIKWPSLKSTLREKWKFKQRVELFESLSGVSLYEISITKTLFARHSALVGKRDKLAHGLTGVAWLMTNQEIRSAVELAAESFSVFAKLHHKYCSIDSPPLPKT